VGEGREVDLQVEAYPEDQRACPGEEAFPMFESKPGIPQLKRTDKVEGTLTRKSKVRMAKQVGTGVAQGQTIWALVIPGLPPPLSPRKELLVVKRWCW